MLNCLALSLVRPDFFLLVELRDFFFRFRFGGIDKKSKKKSSENDQLTGNWSFSEPFFPFFFSELFFSFFLISPEITVKLYIYSRRVCKLTNKKSGLNTSLMLRMVACQYQS